ncbi:MAG: hypothetical protein COV74_03535 [Candidatus Omnitrophica bacterium CG11_big_fil_rev_8_21_14_0_20_45_26]|uniref:DUF6966 domain-containing protein n=1 Tax=Candidatus Abzuiibacterium crystallinum TaxID=1974748 RepID=A0A2H0LQN6_9BACT|nr:MAG: hypothetical protein COV74_03535 [Candidatus Omnitrophica bacterium CG11_big_fil_rev_8_21_14_0_20_45_26]PIW63354.1 MAG: hypothetical protein COW12_10730 [Candidatus Omnitrophica bacterium CG12_big_fil_rev_8_21_14_0_65_45_16]
MKLERLLKQLYELLDKHGIDTWAVRIKQVRDRLGNCSDDSVVEDLKKFFQGAGTLDDLVILQSNGHRIEKKEEKKVNKYLEYLIQEIKNCF